MLNQRHEPRKTIRRPARRAASMSLGLGKPSVNCLIWDISDKGARLAVPHSLPALPHHFTLSWFKDGSAKRDCEVVWTDRRFVAVKFMERVP
jgi:hypothetical protein